MKRYVFICSVLLISSIVTASAQESSDQNQAFLDFQQRKDVAHLLWDEVYKEFGHKLRISAIATVCKDGELAKTHTPSEKEVINLLVEKQAFIRAKNKDVDTYLNKLSTQHMLSFLDSIYLHNFYFILGYAAAIQVIANNDKEFCKQTLEGIRRNGKRNK